MWLAGFFFVFFCFGPRLKAGNLDFSQPGLPPVIWSLKLRVMSGSGVGIVTPSSHSSAGENWRLPV